MLTLATCLSREHSVSILWDPFKEAAIREEAKRKFSMDLGEISFTPSIFGTDYPFLKKLRASRQYDLIIVLSDGSIPWVSCPLILHFQTPVEWVNGNSLLNQLKLRRVRSVLCNSVFTKKLIDKKFHINSAVLYPPVPLPKQASYKKQNLILNVGRFGVHAAGSSYKKQEVLVQSFQQMLKNGLTEWELVFIMSVTEAEKEKAEAFIRPLKNLPIKVIINPDGETLADYYAKASLYWHAAGFGEDLKKHPDRAEHFGIATVEAMGYGAVPIVINAGGQPEIVRDTIDGFLWETTDELIEKTKLLMKDKKLRQEMSAKAEKRAHEFDIQHFSEAVQNIVT